MTLSTSSQSEEEVGVKTLVPEPPVEALNRAVLHGFSRANEIELNVVQVGPRLKLA